MNLQLFTGSCPEAAAVIANELQRIEGADVELIGGSKKPDDDQLVPFEPIRLAVEGKVAIESYDDICLWMKQFHCNRCQTCPPKDA